MILLMLCAMVVCLVVFDSVLSYANTQNSIPPPHRSTANTTDKNNPSPVGFREWLTEFARYAVQQGIAEADVQSALRVIRYTPQVIEYDRNQAEFTKSLAGYLHSAVSATRVANGKIALQQYGTLLHRIEERYGVPAEIVVAIWGLESSYGTRTGDIPTLSALATLAYDGRRADFFEKQLFAALKIIADDHVSAQNMRGSWAGAMGHTQFIPSTYLDYAVDFHQDGKSDIWSNDPTDALASTAAYLAAAQWNKDEPWAILVNLPPDFDYTLADIDMQKSITEWRNLGITLHNGQPLPNINQNSNVSIILPAGHQGSALAILPNFHAIRHYNNSTAYVIGVGILADQLNNKTDTKNTYWGQRHNTLSRQEIMTLQTQLTQHGFDTYGLDGLLGPNTKRAIRRFQIQNGLIPDGYPSKALLDTIKQKEF